MISCNREERKDHDRSGLRTQDSGLRTQALRCALVLLTLAALDGAIRAQTPTPATSTHVLFEPNVGQWPSSVLFEARTRAGRIHGLRDGFVMSRRTSQGWAAATLRFLDAPGVSTAEPSDPDICRVNRYIGNDASKWFEGIPTYRKMKLPDLYEGVDLALRGDDGLFAFDLHVASGVPTDRIRFRIVEEGFTSELVDRCLVIRRDGEVFMRLMPPMSFQLDDARSVPVASRFVELAPGVFGFEVLRRDPALPLVIDPVVALFSTFLGGNFIALGDFGRSIAVDKYGNVYAGEDEGGGVHIWTSAPSMVTFGPFTPTYMLIAKYSPSGPALWVSHIGGTGVDIVEGLDLVLGKGLFVGGDTSSTDFPTITPSTIPVPPGPPSQDLVMLRLNEATGVVTASDVFGGSGTDTGARIAVNATGTEVLFTGDTNSIDLVPAGIPSLYPFSGGVNDAFLISLSYAGTTPSMRYATYFGGSSFDLGRDVAIDSMGRAYIVGETRSPSLPIPGLPIFSNLVPGGGASSGEYDAFLAGFSFQGGILNPDFATFFGGGTPSSGTLPTDRGSGLDIDSTGSTIVITGETRTTDLPTTPGVLQTTNAGGIDGFVASLALQRATGTSPNILSLSWATYLGGTGSDRAKAVVLDDYGRVFVGGDTGSSGFPILNAAQSVKGGGNDAFVTKMATNGASLFWSTFWGGPENDDVWDLDATRDGNWSAVVGIAKANGAGMSSFPVVNPEQPAFGGPPTDAMVFSLGEPDILVQPTTVNVKTPSGTTLAINIRITNVGATTLRLSAIPAGPISSGSAFSVVGGLPAATPIAPSTSIMLTINFAPTAPNATYHDILLIGSDDLDESTVAVTLIGQS